MMGNMMGNMVEVRLIKRILNACIREELLPYELKNNNLTIRLIKCNAKIIVNKVKFFKLSNFKLNGNVLLYMQEEVTKLESISQLIDMLSSELSSMTTVNQWGKFRLEILNCFENELLTVEQSLFIDKCLAKEFANSKHKSFIEFITAKFNIEEQLKFFERWSNSGHPLHPCHRTKLGLTRDEYIKFSPEFEQEIYLPMAAVYQPLMHHEGMPFGNLEYKDWFQIEFAKQYEMWQIKMKKMELCTDNYYPIFVHPWQYDNMIIKMFACLIEDKSLILFNDIAISVQSSISFRTLISQEQEGQPHIKLPVAIQSTSAVRTVSPASVQNGPKLSYILQQILNKENFFSNSIKVAYEMHGLHINENPEIAKHLSIIYRDNPSKLVDYGYIPIVVAGLFEKVPQTQESLLKDIINNYINNYNGSVINYFTNYVDVVLKAFFDLYLIYGIALEGHQQNTIMVFDNNCCPAYVIVRDLGGMKIHVPTLLKNGLDFKSYPLSSIIAEQEIELTNTFLHAVIQSHLGGVVLLLAEEYNQPEDEFWQVLKDKLINRFNLLRDRVCSLKWQREYSAILEHDWQVKGLMRMRLNDVSNKYVYITLDNPLNVA
jgi:siderophore synthetase component